MRVVMGLPGDGESLIHVDQAVMHEVAYEVVGGTVECEASLTSGGYELHAAQQRKLMARDG